MNNTGEPTRRGREADPGVSEQEDKEDRLCWVCRAEVIKRHCKIICPRCGFTRDCSDP